MCVTRRSCSPALAISGSTGPPASTTKASVPGPAATRYVFESQPSLMDRSRIMDGTLRGMPRGRWVFASLVPFGWVTWAGFGYAGFRARRPAWVVAGAVYLAITAGTLFVTSLDDNTSGVD